MEDWKDNLKPLTRLSRRMIHGDRWEVHFLRSGRRPSRCIGMLMHIFGGEWCDLLSVGLAEEEVNGCHAASRDQRCEGSV